MSAGPRDRKTTTKERQNPTHPNPPLNSNVQWSFSSPTKAIDIYWDDPALLANNTGFEILGVNVYRSFDSELGPYHRLNTNPIGSLFYRDETKADTIIEEDVSGRFVARPDEAGNWVFRTLNFPITRPNDPQSIANTVTDAQVFIDGVEVPVANVVGHTGDVTLQTAYRYDVATNQRLDPILPRPDSVVTCTYSYNTNLLDASLYQRTFYRVTTVGRDKWDNILKETPLAWTNALHIQQMENLDYIWREAIRRNRWILDQGGERVKVFIHKYRGIPCKCTKRYDDPHPKNDCPKCFSTGFLGGYEGPFEMLMAPPDTERSIRQSDRGRHQEMTYDVWTGPSPLLSQRDFMVKLNGDRYSIGPVRMPTNRGNVLQQHFNVSVLDHQDIRYQVPVTGTDTLAFPETRTMKWDDYGDEVRYPQITEKSEVFNGIEERGRTPVYENINYGSPNRDKYCPPDEDGPQVVTLPED